MFMLNAAALATPADAPDPVQDPPAEGASERISGILGVVLADICRDLGIVPSDPIWRELFLPILGHGGNPSRLAMDSFDRRSEGFFEVYADADVRALIEHRCAPYMPPSLALSGAGPP